MIQGDVRSYSRGAQPIVSSEQRRRPAKQEIRLFIAGRALKVVCGVCTRGTNERNTVCRIGEEPDGAEAAKSNSRACWVVTKTGEDGWKTGNRGD
ncbi:hypothetical protein L596_028355 [Steinernema carpocapsae]|uniref:Uncharacterized protein n=1 Tax=Steinernema carpocapsae TaxID=34508 RepID=A0A4U5LYB0_STECR|nr:hypothetical protein L596_028355 [Steinernema carpocapsae]